MLKSLVKILANPVELTRISIAAGIHPESKKELAIPAKSATKNATFELGVININPKNKI